MTGSARRSFVAGVGLFPKLPRSRRSAAAVARGRRLMTWSARSPSATLSRRAARKRSRRSHLLGDDDEPVRVTDAAVYRRRVILEFLLHQMKRLLQLETFSVLLVKWLPGETNSHDEDQPAKWLALLKGCLRDVDLIGQLADVLYIVLLPCAKRREAEALRQRIETELGPGSPFVLSAAEIKERKDLAGVLAGLAERSGPK